MTAVTGLFYSGVFGTILAYAGDSFPRYPATVVGLVLAAGSSGAVLGPWLIGSIAESASLTVALGVVASTMFATGCMYVLLGSSRPDTQVETTCDGNAKILTEKGEYL